MVSILIQKEIIFVRIKFRGISRFGTPFAFCFELIYLFLLLLSLPYP